MKKALDDLLREENQMMRKRMYECVTRGDPEYND